MGLLSPSAINEIATTTLANRSGVAADNITKNNALLNRLEKRGKVKPVSGGRTIRQELQYAENGTYKRYSGYEVLNVAPSDVLTSAEFNFAQSAVAVTMSGLEMIQNAGEDQIIDLLEARIQVAEETLTNNIALDCYSDGTADGGRQIGGLAYLVSTTPTNTVGGINAGLYPFWQNVVYSGISNGGATTSTSNIQTYMNRIWTQLVRGADAPDLIVADNNMWRYYLESLQAIQRITSDSEASAGFSSLKYMTADVILDGGVGGGAPANTMYFLNTKYIFFRPHAQRNMVPIGSEREAVNQDAMVKLIGFAGNMTVSNRRLQGVLIP